MVGFDYRLHGKKPDDNGKRHHLRVIAAHYHVEPRQCLLFDDSDSSLDSRGDGWLGVKVRDRSIGFQLNDFFAFAAVAASKDVETESKQAVDVVEAAAEVTEVAEAEEQKNSLSSDTNTDSISTKQKGRLVDDDERRKGALNGEAIQHYVSAAGGWWWLCGGCTLGTIAYGLMAANDLWLAGWVSPSNTLTTVTRASVYVGLSLGQSLAVWSLSMWNNCATNRASRTVHHDCINRLLHAPSSWFQKTPSGRILSRFSGDMAM
jgi:hypothetical protein